MEVEPVRDLKQVKQMYQWLNKHYTPREAEFWLIGCNIALRAGDMLALRFDQIENGQKTVVLTEQKTRKHKEFPITPTVREAVARIRAFYDNTEFYATKKFEPIYIFQSSSHRAYNLVQPVGIKWFSKVLKEASRDMKFDFNLNTHSMRKTWGYHAYEGGADILYIQALFNHQHQYVTLRYIGVTKSTLLKMYFDNTLEIA